MVDVMLLFSCDQLHTFTLFNLQMQHTQEIELYANLLPIGQEFSLRFKAAF